MYGIVIIAVVMFGGCFCIQDYYRRIRGVGGVRMSLESTFIGSLAGVVVLLVANCLVFEGGFRFDAGGLNPGFTPFTLLMAVLAAANGFLFTYCSFKALGKINLSMFSVFSMLGGMALPFVIGILFYGEAVTWAKAVCVLFICASLSMTLSFDKEKSPERRKEFLYYAGIFVTNGMSGVLSQIFSASDLPKTTSAGYSVWLALVSAAVAGVLLVTLFRKKEEAEPPLTLKEGAVCGVQGALSKIANFLLVLALANGVEASAQYPLVTGGVMIVSTLAAYLTDNKPGKKDLISVGLAFLGTLALFVIPV